MITPTEALTIADASDTILEDRVDDVIRRTAYLDAWPADVYVGDMSSKTREFIKKRYTQAGWKVTTAGSAANPSLRFGRPKP